MIRRLERPGAPHNIIGHPLLVVCPPLGHWVHEHTAPVVPTRYARRLDRVDGWPAFHLFRRSTR